MALKLTLSHILAVCVGAGVAFILGTSPTGVTPPVIPEDSPLLLFPIPPWPLFRVGVAINDFLVATVKAATPPRVRVMDLASSYYKSEVTYILAYHRIPDVLSKSSKSCELVAKELDFHEKVLCRIMNAGYHIGLLLKNKEGHYYLSETGKLLQKDVPGSLLDFVLMANEEGRRAYRAGGIKSIKSAKSGFEEEFGEGWFSWHAKHPKQEAQFNRAMASMSYSAVAAIIADWRPPEENITFCDIGGGIGAMLITLLKHYPKMSGLVLEQPILFERIEENFEENGISDRASPVSGNFFESFPREFHSCDIFHMKFILHDWHDEDCIALLKNIKEVAKPGSKVLITEMVRGVNGPTMEEATTLLDIAMLAATGTPERSFEEYQMLFRSAGYRNSVRHIPLRDIISLVEVEV